MIDVGGIKSFINQNNNIQCKDFDQRSIVLDILRQCGMRIGFSEQEFEEHFYVSRGSFRRDEIHCAKRHPLWSGNPVISGEEFLQTFCGWKPESRDRDFAPPTMAEIDSLYRIERKHLML